MRVDWCVSSWFRIKNTHSHSLDKNKREQGSRPQITIYVWVLELFGIVKNLSLSHSRSSCALRDVSTHAEESAEPAPYDSSAALFSISICIARFSREFFFNSGLRCVACSRAGALLSPARRAMAVTAMSPGKELGARAPEPPARVCGCAAAGRPPRAPTAAFATPQRGRASAA